MNAENPVNPNAQGPYAYPTVGVPAPAQAGQAAPAMPQTYQQPAAPSAQHPQAGQRPAVAPATQAAAPAQPSAAPAHQPGATHAQPSATHAQPSATTAHQPGATGAQAVSGSAPVRASLRKDSGETGTPEQGGEEKQGMLAGLARLIGRRPPETGEGVTGTGQLKKGVGPRRVRAMMTKLDPWSVWKLAFLLSIATGIAFVVATSIVWQVLNERGVFLAINDQITTILGPESKTAFLQFTDKNRIMSVAILLAVINSALMTALATIGAILYNLIVKLVGGVYITLSDE